MSRPLGAVATPPTLADRLVAPLAREGRLLDPACGEGELLLAAARARGGGRGAAEGLFGLETDPELARRARARLVQATGISPGAAAEVVATTDALEPGRPWPAGTAVVANPPWASYSGRAARRPGPRSTRPPAPRGWPSLHGAFLVRIAAHVALEERRARVLLPASCCDLDGYAPLRREVTASCLLGAPPEELGEEAFPGVREPAVLLELLPRSGPGDGSDAPWTPVAEGVAPLLARLERFPRLAPECYGDPGVHTGNAAALLLIGEPGPGAPGVREGRDLAAFALEPPRRGLRVDLEAPDRTFRIGPLERYVAARVLVRQTASRPIAAVHDAPTYFRNSLLAVRPPEGLHPAFVAAVLNGPVAAAWHRLKFRDARQRTFPQVKVGHLRTQPFPIAHRDEDRALHDELVARVHDFAPEQRSAIDALALAAFGLPRGLDERVRTLASV